jgi:hypothetical protein
LLPDRGGETLHHVHAEDVAGLHQACLEQPDAATGQSFNSMCTQAFTLARLRRGRGSPLRP